MTAADPGTTKPLAASAATGEMARTSRSQQMRAATTRPKRLQGPNGER